MKSMSKMKLAILLAATIVVGASSAATAAQYFRQYYSRGWSYHPTRHYHYRRYYYKPYRSYSGYRHHYCVYYKARPRYVYYYNPYRRVYWGRYDLEDKGYSHLKKEDQSGNLDSIKESAFPKAGPMPSVPEVREGDNVTITPPPVDDLPK